MTKAQVIRSACVEIARADMKIKQADLATGITVVYTRTQFGGMLEKHYPRHGRGWGLKEILDEAAQGLPGVKVEKDPVNGRVFVYITGL
jgi:Fe-S oxidoreductase